ncbi:MULTISPECIES: DUF445 domain-containing protein [Shewanella]|uniref:DUF445 domain-containing protein n=1 Tax=Shewanella TaxID=22 RepID=UPI00193D2E75|nr:MULTISPECIES: DUF445 domain-containing protein [Shewanella]MDI5841250.1 DUF445 domain-containing protein [Shewanella xiamenensis]MDI5844911.1 DUF445 domain-containing protein [Shewanella xiamenensis]MDI5852925.1 DUF445 domain-containing protein [Shewanella xiamenensis]MDI5857108.1 DUF445 domain-containing protein [Shewanella xiamenensis]MDI5860847.1 DUF445 domain-containing protein [Shewanella xiamenensis]
MNKSLVTNVLAAICVILGYALSLPILFNVGLFALSGAITNWLAVYMLFEKVPGLYGSGVVPSRFEEFKLGIAHLMMKQFFTAENIDRFLSEKEGISQIDLAPVIEKVDLAPSFDALVNTVAQSSFGGMLAMFGGTEALMPLKEPFIEKMKASLVDMAESEQFRGLLKQELEQPNVMADLQQKIANIVEQRLNELTPQMVKQIVQEMIQTHLGWLVVWGGVFGGAIGLVAALVQG